MSRRLMPICVLAATFACAAPALWPQSSVQAEEPEQRFIELGKSTSLLSAGLHPWHLRMSFQLYDLKGKPKETGTVEQWWAAPGSYRMVIASPGYHRTTPSATEESDGEDRIGYLVNLLLEQVTHPVPEFRASNHLRIGEYPRTFAKTTLSCLTETLEKSPNVPGPTYCTEPGTQILRIALDNGNLTLVRNRMANFQKIGVALDNSVSYGATQAISGHVDLLEGYDPVKIPLELTKSSTDNNKIPSVVLAGKILSKTAPVYPPFAWLAGVSGSIILHAVIGKDGHIRDLHVIAGADPNLSAAAIAAVKQWTYAPYLIDGSPVEVDTTITVNFNFGR